jgi:predicted transcriptional regulator
MTKRSRQQGELETLVLDALWDSIEPLTSNQILNACNEHDTLALTTILTVLSRLEDKELVIRKPGAGRSNLYQAASSREEHAAAQLLAIFAESGDAALTLSHFTAGLNKKSVAALKKLLDNK